MLELMQTMLAEMQEHRAMLVKTSAAHQPGWTEALLPRLSEIQGAIEAVKAVIEIEKQQSGIG